MIDLDVTLNRPGFSLEAAVRLDQPITGIVGPSGAGKSTLLSLIAGLERPTQGRIRIDGEVVCDTYAGQFTPTHRRGVGMVFQDSLLFPHLSVRRNLLYGSKRAGAEGGPRLASVAQALEIGHLLERRVAGLSGGERQRIALGRAVLSHPRLLLLDEPWASLDGPLRDRMIPMIVRLHEHTRIPIVVVSHQVRELLRLTPYLLAMREGECVATGRLPDLLQHPAALTMLQQSELVNVVRGQVASHSACEGATRLLPLGARGERHDDAAMLAGLRPELLPGDMVDMIIEADDIALATHEPEGISIQNRLLGRVAALAPSREGVVVTVEVADARVPLLARLTHRAVRNLQLHLGCEVWCLFKASSVGLHPAGRGVAAEHRQPAPKPAPPRWRRLHRLISSRSGRS